MKRGAAAGLIAAALLASPMPGAAQSSGEPPLLLLENGRVWTNDPSAPEGTALLVRGERIVWVGATGEAPVVGQDVERIDLGGRRVIPGFNDAHTHFRSGGFDLLAPDLLEVSSAEEFVRQLREHARSLPPGRWIYLDYAWDHQRWADPTLPSRALVDSVTPENPLWMTRTDGHIGLANSRALEAAGITAGTPDPAGGQIDRDPASGEPTGILRDASSLITSAVPPSSEEEVRVALDAALAHAARVGVTSVQDMCYGDTPATATPEWIRLLQEYAEEERLTARVYCRTGLPHWADPAAVGVTAGFGDAWVRLGSLKGFADGALGSSTAYMAEPYADDSSNRGLLDAVMQPPDSFRALAAAADRARLQLSIHAIGDAAISLVLDQFERIRDENEPWDRRWRIEHAQHMAAGDFARMADLGVVASVQPFHAIDDGRWAERRIGPERAKTTYPFRSFLDAGVPLAFGTDWPVAPLEPLRSVYAAVTRRTLEGAHPEGWVPEEKVTVAEALAAYSSGSAYAEFADHEKGRLAPGFLADLVVLSDDPFRIDPAAIGDIDVLLTMVGGRVVHADEPFGALAPPSH